jgi:hypothetical protein
LAATLKSVESARTEESANTGRVLRSLWEEADRIEGSRIEAIATTSCIERNSRKPVPVIGKGATVFLTVLNKESLEALREWRQSSAGWAAVATSLFSVGQEELTLDAEMGGVGVRFPSFYALVPDLISSFDLWRGAYVEMSLSAPAPPPSLTKALASSRSTSPPEVGAGASAPIALVRERDGTSHLLAEFAAEPVNNSQLPIFAGR